MANIRLKYGAVQIVVGRGTVRDDLHAQVIRAKLIEAQDNSEEYTLYKPFSDLCAHCRKAVGLPFDPLGLHSRPKEEVWTAYQKWLDLDNAFKDKWIAAMVEADRPADEVIGPEPLAEGADPLP